MPFIPVTLLSSSESWSHAPETWHCNEYSPSPLITTAPVSAMSAYADERFCNYRTNALVIQQPSQQLFCTFRSRSCWALSSGFLAEGCTLGTQIAELIFKPLLMQICQLVHSRGSLHLAKLCHFQISTVNLQIKYTCFALSHGQ